MSVATKHMAAEAREEVFALKIDFTIGDAAFDHRVYPPPSGDYRLVSGRWEIVSAILVSTNPTVDIKDASGNAIVTQLSLPGIQALGTRGTFTITGTEAQLNIHANGGNAYHALVAGGTGSAGPSGAIQIWLYYRRVQPSGDLSQARLA